MRIQKPRMATPLPSLPERSSAFMGSLSGLMVIPRAAPPTVTATMARIPKTHLRDEILRGGEWCECCDCLMGGPSNIWTRISTRRRYIVNKNKRRSNDEMDCVPGCAVGDAADRVYSGD